MDNVPVDRGVAVSTALFFGVADLAVTIGMAVLHVVRAMNADLQWGTVALLALAAPHLYLGTLSLVATAAAVDPQITFTLAILAVVAMLLDIIALFVRIFDAPAETAQFNTFALIGASLWVASTIGLSVSAMVFSTELNKFIRRTRKWVARSLKSKQLAEEFWAVSKDLYYARRTLGVTWVTDLVLYTVFILIYAFRLWSSVELSAMFFFTLPHLFKFMWVRAVAGAGEDGDIPTPGITRPNHPVLRITQIIVFATMVLDIFAALVIIAVLVFGSDVADIETTSIFGLGDTVDLVLGSINAVLVGIFVAIDSVEMGRLFWLDMVLKTMASDKKHLTLQLRELQRKGGPDFKTKVV